jgi:hypothetical protein
VLPVFGISVLRAEGFLEVLELVLRIFRLVVFSISIVNDSSDNGSGFLFGLEDLNEGVLMAKSFFADFAVVEVLADATLVSDSTDGTDPAAVTGNIQMLNDLTGVDLLFVGVELERLSDFLALHQLLEYERSLLLQF